MPASWWLSGCRRAARGGGAACAGPGGRSGRPDPGQEPPRPFPVAPQAGLAGATTWTLKHRDWSAAKTSTSRPWGPPSGRYRATVECREAELEAVEADLGLYLEVEPFAAAVARLSAYRGVERLGGLVLQAEIVRLAGLRQGDCGRAFCGLVPSEYSSGEKVTRVPLTHTGNAHLRRQLIEAAWAYTTGPSLGAALRRRQEGVPAETLARAWASQVDLCRRFRALDKRKSVRGVVVAATARRLIGHLHAEMVA